MSWCGAICIAVSLWLDGHGYTVQQRNAVLSYIHHESDFDPCEVSRNGAFLFQWAGSRRRQILALGNGRCPSLETQLEFADSELRTTFSRFWSTNNPRTYIRRCFGAGACR